MKVVDLFSGSGLFSSGFYDVAFDVVFGIDMDKKCCHTFSFNFPNAKVVCEDILEFNDFPEADVVIGSPPCKEFSKGNINRVFDYSLVERFIEVVKQIKPKFYVMENVPDMATLEFIEKYRDFFPTMQVLDASSFGAATWRKRLFAGNFPKVKATVEKPLSVQEVIDVNRSGYRQPFKEKVYRKIDPSKPIFTICSQRIGNERYLLPNGTSLEVSELAKLHGVPSWFVFPCSRSEMQRQLGLSVSPPVARAIALKIWEAL